MTEIKELNDPSLRKIIKNKKQVVLIPVGSIEQHGPHLPISTDSDIVSEIANQVSKKTNCLLMPTINYGVSFEHSPFFNVSITESTLEKILVDICISLQKNGINDIIILNGHHGNQHSLVHVPKKVLKISKRNVRVLIFSYWNFMKREFDHAGFVETSIMLAISNKVKMSRATKGLVIEGMSPKEKTRIRRLATKSFINATKNGIWGDPRKATKKDGQKILVEIVQNLVKKVKVALQT
ncbi:MAG: creatininase family protein [Nitrosopumilaceae archaeon]|nr:MAG: creatininase family protein [Marine Group I thaumarchaeote]